MDGTDKARRRAESLASWKPPWYDGTTVVEARQIVHPFGGNHQGDEELSGERDDLFGETVAVQAVPQRVVPERSTGASRHWKPPWG